MTTLGELDSGKKEKPATNSRKKKELAPSTLGRREGVGVSVERP